MYQLILLDNNMQENISPKHKSSTALHLLHDEHLYSPSYVYNSGGYIGWAEKTDTAFFAITLPIINRFWHMHRTGNLQLDDA